MFCASIKCKENDRSTYHTFSSQASHLTVELTRRRDQSTLRRIILVAKHDTAARVQRFVRLRPTHQFRTKIQIPRPIHKTEQAVTMIVGIVSGSLKNMTVEAKYTSGNTAPARTISRPAIRLLDRRRFSLRASVILISGRRKTCSQATFGNQRASRVIMNAIAISPSRVALTRSGRNVSMFALKAREANRGPEHQNGNSENSQ